MSLSGAGSGLCEDVVMAIDTELGQLITSCDAGGGDFSSLGDIPEIESLACVELDYLGPGGGIWAGRPAGERFLQQPRDGGSGDRHDRLEGRRADNWLIQSITFKPEDPLAGLRVRSAGPSLSARHATGRWPTPREWTRWRCAGRGAS